MPRLPRLQRQLGFTAALAVALGVAVSVSGCGNHPTRDACTKFAEHYIELAVAQYEIGTDMDLARETAEGAKGQFINHCVDSGVSSELECGMKAQNIEEFKACLPEPPVPEKKNKNNKKGANNKDANADAKKADAKAG